ncbi:MAG: tRNA uracil 4-sulfurtransferase ThiI [Culicoidibacterales bacterium]
MERIILIRYGELMTKGDNKKLFQGRLLATIKHHLQKFDVEITRTRDRIYIENIETHFDEVSETLRHIFGIYSFSLATKVKSDIDVITQTAQTLFKDIDNCSIRLETKRSDKQFPMMSMDVSRHVSKAILQQAKNMTVDLSNPDETLMIEIRPDFTYLMFKKIDGAKGYPTGSVGKGILMLSGGIDSPVAGYLAMKRGISIEAIHFESPPYTTTQAREKVLTLAKKLAKYTPNQKLKVHIVPFTDMQIALHKAVMDSYEMTIMRRMMYRITERMIMRQKATLLINGECLGQVASQTPQSMETIHRVIKQPVIAPLVTYDKEEVIEISKSLDFYQTSILPFEDCCTIFVPKRPVTKPKYYIAEEEEAKFDWESLMQKSLENIKTITVDYNASNETDEFDSFF